MKEWGAQNGSYFFLFSLSFSGEKKKKMEISVPHGMRIELGCHFLPSLVAPKKDPKGGSNQFK
jgi:hypothetical protein